MLTKSATQYLEELPDPAAGTLIAQLAHEVANSITNILMGVRSIAGRPDIDKNLRETLDIVSGSARQCNEIIQNAVRYARREPTKKSFGDLNELVLESVAQLAPFANARRSEVVLDLNDDIPSICCNAIEIEQVITNLVRNAIQSRPTSVRVTVRTRIEEYGVTLTVLDDGPGIPVEQQRRIFSPFFTTRKNEGGTGLGLSIVHAIVAAHGARISLSSQVGCGTSFAIRFAGGEAMSRSERFNMGAVGTPIGVNSYALDTCAA